MIKARSLALKAKKYNVMPTDKTPTIVTTHKRIMPPLNKKWKGYVVATEITKTIINGHITFLKYSLIGIPTKRFTTNRQIKCPKAEQKNTARNASSGIEYTLRRKKAIGTELILTRLPHNW